MCAKKWGFVIFSICMILASPSRAISQEAGTDANRATELELLRKQLQNQSGEIAILREEIKTEANRRIEQQRLLEAAIERLDRLGAVLAEKAEPVPSPSSAPASPDSSVSAATSVASAAPAVKPQTSPANVVETGVGKVKFTGLLQGWYVGGNGGFNDTFRIRSAELRFTGEIMPKVRWSVMFDLAKALSLNTTTSTIDGSPIVRNVSVNQASRIFQEAYISLGHFKRANINIGQFKIPVSQEGLQSSAALDTVERALFLTDRARGGGLGNVRDIGIMAYGPLNSQVDYQFGIFNGLGEIQNDVDQNEQKAFAGRIVFKPAFVKGLQIGGSGAFTAGPDSSAVQRNRLGAELVYDRGKIRAKSEFMTGADGPVHRRGFYSHIGYRFYPKIEGIFRFDMFDPDIRRENSPATVTERDFIAGINYFIKDNNFKLQLNYIRKTFAAGLTESRNVFLANLQSSW